MKPVPKQSNISADKVFNVIIKLNSVNHDKIIMGNMKTLQKVTKENIAQECDCDVKYIIDALRILQRGGWIMFNFERGEYVIA